MFLIKLICIFVHTSMIKLLYKTSNIALLICLCLFSNAQLVDNTSTFRNINHEKYVRFHYDNDFFTKSDEYYSQGITLDYVHPVIKRFPLAKLLWKPYKTKAQYGVAFNLFGYTPTSILSDEILYSDRPFNANISLKIFLIQPDDVHKQQVSTAFSIGVMGPAAQGYEIQYNIHRWLDNPLPHGWQHQIKNDIILNYQINYEKQIAGASNHFVLNSTSEIRLGTLNNKINTGLNFMVGNFNKRYTAIGFDKKKVSYYLYGQSRVNLIGYDASMQGGLFNRKSPYTISASDITRLTFQADAGIIVNYKKLLLSYTQSFLTKEFRSGNYHRWGGITVGFAF
jgi:lipid A 3-O-deacylase